MAEKTRKSSRKASCSSGHFFARDRSKASDSATSQSPTKTRSSLHLSTIPPWLRRGVIRSKIDRVSTIYNHQTPPPTVTRRSLFFVLPPMPQWPRRSVKERLRLIATKTACSRQFMTPSHACSRACTSTTCSLLPCFEAATPESQLR